MSNVTSRLDRETTTSRKTKSFKTSDWKSGIKMSIRKQKQARIQSTQLCIYLNTNVMLKLKLNAVLD